MIDQAISTSIKKAFFQDLIHHPQKNLNLLLINVKFLPAAL